MTYADFDYYRNAYHGILIKSADDYAYFAERAGDELAPLLTAFQTRKMGRPRSNAARAVSPIFCTGIGSSQRTAFQR